MYELRDMPELPSGMLFGHVPRDMSKGHASKEHVMKKRAWREVKGKRQ